MQLQSNSMYDPENKTEKLKRALGLFIESVYKPDDKLRSCAHNQKCYHELMEVRDEVLVHLYGKLNQM